MVSATYSLCRTIVPAFYIGLYLGTGAMFDTHLLPFCWCLKALFVWSGCPGFGNECFIFSCCPPHDAMGGSSQLLHGSSPANTRVRTYWYHPSCILSAMWFCVLAAFSSASFCQGVLYTTQDSIGRCALLGLNRSTLLTSVQISPQRSNTPL